MGTTGQTNTQRPTTGYQQRLARQQRAIAAMRLAIATEALRQAREAAA